MHDIHEYIHADVRVDLGGEDLPPDRYQETWEKTVEICAMRKANLRCSHRIQEQKELQDIEAQELAIPDDQTNEWPSVKGSSEDPAIPGESTGMTIEDMLKAGPSMTPIQLDDDCFFETIKKEYGNNPFFKLILDDPTANRVFEVKDGLV